MIQNPMGGTDKDGADFPAQDFRARLGLGRFRLAPPPSDEALDAEAVFSPATEDLVPSDDPPAPSNGVLVGLPPLPQPKASALRDAALADGDVRADDGGTSATSPMTGWMGRPTPEDPSLDQGAKPQRAGREIAPLAGPDRLPPFLQFDGPLALVTLAALPADIIVGSDEGEALDIGPMELRYACAFVSAELDGYLQEEDDEVGEPWVDEAGVLRTEDHPRREAIEATVRVLLERGLIEAVRTLPNGIPEPLDGVMDPYLPESWMPLVATEDRSIYRVTPLGAVVGRSVWGARAGGGLWAGEDRRMSIRVEAIPDGADPAPTGAVVAAANHMALMRAEAGALDRGALGAILLERARSVEDLSEAALAVRDEAGRDLAVAGILNGVAEFLVTLEASLVDILEDPIGMDPRLDAPTLACDYAACLISVGHVRDRIVAGGYPVTAFDAELRMGIGSVAAGARAMDLIGAAMAASGGNGAPADPAKWLEALADTDRGWIVALDGDAAHSLINPIEVEVTAGRLLEAWIDEVSPEGKAGPARDALAEATKAHPAA
jgi:hypothetical protein